MYTRTDEYMKRRGHGFQLVNIVVLVCYTHCIVFELCVMEKKERKKMNKKSKFSCLVFLTLL